jgi:superoxide dismutase
VRARTYEASLDTLDRARQLAHRLFNVWIDEHDRGALAGCPLVLVMDLFEHAYLTDYGTKRADYIDAFLAAADWEEAGRRFEAAQAPVPDVVRA